MEKKDDYLVKGVLSGDTLILSGKVKKDSEDIPEEKIVRLSCIQVPRCGTSNNLLEEPYGWQAREYLRKVALGKVAKFSEDYKIKELVFGQVTIGGKSIAIGVVEQGFANVSNVSKQNDKLATSDYYVKLKAAEESAIKEQLGIHGDAKEGEKTVRKVIILPSLKEVKMIL